MTLMHKDKSKALNEYLEWCHAEQYTGLDDEMGDDCCDWIDGLTEDELCNLVLQTYKEGL